MSRGSCLFYWHRCITTQYLFFTAEVTEAQRGVSKIKRVWLISVAPTTGSRNKDKIIKKKCISYTFLYIEPHPKGELCSLDYRPPRMGSGIVFVGLHMVAFTRVCMKSPPLVGAYSPLWRRIQPMVKCEVRSAETCNHG